MAAPALRGDIRNSEYRVAGVVVDAVFDKRTVVGPASYATDGIPVDLSAIFSTLRSVRILRAYVTATGVVDGREYQVNEISTDTLANRKFRIKVFRATAPGATTFGDFLSATGTANSITCAAVAGSADLVQAAGAGKTAAVVALTGATTLLTEIAAATNLAAITVEYEAIGVPV